MFADGPKVHTILAFRTGTDYREKLPLPYDAQRIRKVPGQRGVEVHPPPGDGVLETQSGRVQPLPFQPQPTRQLRVTTVERVAAAGMPDRGHVHPDLVGAPCPSKRR